MFLKADISHITSGLRLFLLYSIALLLSACTSQRPQPPTSVELPVAKLQQWTIRGKLGVRAPRDNGSANLLWQQQTAQNYRIHLSGLLGAGATVISGSPAGVSLQRGSEPPLKASNPAELTTQTLGWPLPVTEMFYWVRGMAAPVPAAQSERRNAAGQLQSLRQAGWQLNFSGYQNIGTYVLPTRIKAETRQAGAPVKVTLVIKEWLPQN